MQHSALFAIGLLAAAVLPANAATLYVDANHCPSGNGTAWAEAFCTISEAVAAAAPGDSVFVKAGVYRGGIEVKMPLAIYGGFSGTEASPDERDLSVNESVVDISADDAPRRCFYINGASDVVLDGLVLKTGTKFLTSSSGGLSILAENMGARNYIQHCRFDGNTTAYSQSLQGGTLYFSGEEVTLRDCSFGNSSSGSGSLVYLACTKPSGLFDCDFSKNSLYYGGTFLEAAESDAPLYLEGCSFDCVYTESHAVLLKCPATLKSCLFTRCATGANAQGAYLYISQCNFEGNDGPAAAYFGYNNGAMDGRLIVERSTFFDNFAYRWFSAAIDAISASVIIYDSAICNNGGQGISARMENPSSVPVSVTHCTVANNLSNGVYAENVALRANNSIMTGNAGAGVEAYTGTEIRGLYNNVISGNNGNLFAAGTASDTEAAINALDYAADNVVGAPAFRDAENLDFRLLATSAALGMASAIYETYTDLYGNERPRVPGQIDAGAIQLTGIPGPRCTAIARLSTSPTNASLVYFEVYFDGPVSGVDAADFEVAPGGFGANVLGVAPKDDHYLLTVGTGPLDGALGVNLVDDDSIHNTEGIPLGGAGKGNGSVTSERYVIDRTPPAISLLGESPVILQVGDTYTDAGATAVDAVDGVVSDSIITEEKVDTSVPGTYAVGYRVLDAAGNIGGAGRSVIVKALPDFHVTPVQQFVSQQAQDLSFDIYNRTTADAGWSASVSAGTEWCHITAGSTGIGAHGSIAIHVDANASAAARTATIVVSDRAKGALPISVTVQQAAAPPKGFLACGGNSQTVGGSSADVGTLAALAFLLGAVYRKGRA